MSDILVLLWEKNQSSFHLRCDQGRNPLHCAACIGHLEGVNFLLNKMPTSAYQKDKQGFFPIHIAASEGHIDIIQEMLLHCPDSRDLLTSQGHNIFHVTAKSGKATAFRCVLKMPELHHLVNEKDEDGNTPLHIATTHEHPKIVTTLSWDAGVSLELENNEGLTALDIAKENMETMSSFPKRLTLMALRVARAPPSSKVVRNKISFLHDQPKMEKYRDRVNIILVVATLVAAATFTAGFTVPGGYNNSAPLEGMATMLGKHKFQDFVICDMLAMYFSIIVVITLIWAQLGDLSTMEVALKFAVPLLGIALCMMSIAFMAGVYLVVSELVWLANLVLVMGSVFIVALLALFVPLCVLFL